LYEALRLIGLVDQAVSGTGSDAVRHVTWRSIADKISIGNLEEVSKVNQPT
jgi:hypothetical protein